MASPVNTARRVAMAPPWMLISPLVAAVSVVLVMHSFVLELGGTTTTDPYLATHLAMLGALFVAAFASCALRMLGWASRGSAAGLWVAAFALAAREACQVWQRMDGLEGVFSVYVTVPQIRTQVWLGRNLTLVAFGYGLGLVVFASVADVVRRRRDPAWAIDDG